MWDTNIWYLAYISFPTSVDNPIFLFLPHAYPLVQTISHGQWIRRSVLGQCHWMHHSLFNHSSTEGHQCCFHVSSVSKELLWTCVYRFLCESVFSFPWGKCPTMQLLGCLEVVYLGLFVVKKPFSKVTVPFYISTSNRWVIQFFHTLVSIYVSTIYYFSHPDRCVVLCYTFFYVLIGYLSMYLYSHFNYMSGHVFCQVSYRI